MAELSYREAVARAIAQEMARDDRVVLIGEDIAGAGGVFKTTVGLLERFGPRRVIDTPIAEQAILGAAMGAAMTGLRPIAEIMFSDFFAVCWDIVANEIAKTRYMTNGQVTLPLVIKTGNGGALRFGAQHSQSVENWAMAVPGIKVVTPSTPRDVVGLMAAAVRCDDPVLLFEHKGLYAAKGEVPDGEIVDSLGTAVIRRPGRDATVLALGLMVSRALAAADQLAEHGIDVEVIDVRSLVPLDTATILGSVSRTGRLFTVEENPRLLGWGAEIASIAADECFWDLGGPIQRITTPHIPLPAADSLEDLVIPSAEVVATTVEKALQSQGGRGRGGRSGEGRPKAGPGHTQMVEADVTRALARCREPAEETFTAFLTKAAADSLQASGLAGVTFAVIDHAADGVLHDAPGLTGARAAVLTAGVPVERPVVRRGDCREPVIAIRSMVQLALTHDDNAIDCSKAAAFLATLRAKLETGLSG